MALFSARDCVSVSETHNAMIIKEINDNNTAFIGNAPCNIFRLFSKLVSKFLHLLCILTTEQAVEFFTFGHSDF